MKNLILISLFTCASNFMKAQVVNTNSVNIPNTGANTTVPPTQTSPQPTLSIPSNSTVPGANGSYSIDVSKPDFSNPNLNNTQGTTSYSPQTGSGHEQGKKNKK